ncbi:MAG: lactate racemase domain-containing protein [Chloroflexi bacterium]|nr:lactate racemase domain-containing protein [Chloroflexota bacterium]
MVIGKGYTDRFLSDTEVRQIFIEAFAAAHLEGKRCLFIIPDGTRSAPLPLCFRIIADELLGVAARVDFMVATGTHMSMDEAALQRHLGISSEERKGKYAAVGIYNHDWQHNLLDVGTISAAKVMEASNGLMAQDIKILINANIVNYDCLIIVGPVFPHEVVGFSGGNKYLFPGISGGNMIDATHWLSALITSHEIIGTEDTPVRKLLDHAAGFIPVQRLCFSLVVKGHHDLAGVYFGSPEESQAVAANLSAIWNVVWVDKPFKKVISVMPTLYDDLWTGSKGMYKVEPAVEDGGTIIIYAPHITEVSYVHGAILDRVGYHVRDYFLGNWDKVGQEPAAVLAHACHLKGSGTYINGIERARVNVVLATGIPEERCKCINLGYMNPAAFNPQDWMDKESEGILVVPRAGELLYKLKV